MRIVVNGAGTVTAQDASNLNALSVALVDADAELAAKVLGAYGRIDGAHVWLDIERLKSFAPEPRPCSWDQRFAETMAYAQSKGWTDETGQFVRAHIESAEA